MADLQMSTTPREYETIYVLRPDAGREASQDISTRVESVMSKENGSLTRVENWGYRTLAYPVRKHNRGVYVYLKYLGNGSLVSELERNLRLQDVVLKFQTVKVGNGKDVAAAAAEDVAFEHLEVPTDDDPEETLAQSLGLEEARPLQEESAKADAEADSGEAKAEATEAASGEKSAEVAAAPAEKTE